MKPDVFPSLEWNFDKVPDSELVGHRSQRPEGPASIEAQVSGEADELLEVSSAGTGVQKSVPQTGQAGN